MSRIRVPHVSEDLLEQQEWRLNINYDVRIIVLSITLDPRCRMSPLAKDLNPIDFLEYFLDFADEHRADIMSPPGATDEFIRRHRRRLEKVFLSFVKSRPDDFNENDQH